MNKINEIESYAITDSGITRSHNEDAYYCNEQALLFCVADGMGGEAAGEIASTIFTACARRLSPNSKITNEQARQLIEDIFQEANQLILKHVQQHPAHKGMGCTAEVVVICDKKAIIGHVGDSRTYVFSKSALQQLTQDHSLIEEQRKLGIENSSQLKNVILRAVGTENRLEVDITEYKITTGDLILLCSDGLTDMVDDQNIREILQISHPIYIKAPMLIDLANDNGGKDNITVVMLQA